MLSPFTTGVADTYHDIPDVAKIFHRGETSGNDSDGWHGQQC